MATARPLGGALLLALAGLSCGSSSPPLPDLGADARIADRGGERAVDGRAADITECPVGLPRAPDVVATTRGLLRGKPAGSTMSFLGVPYAEPPAGARRFAPPAPRACWSGVREAFAFASRCPQRAVLGGYVGNEDCLYLNVWTPALPSSGKGPRPVLFFIHGGANILGAGNEGAAAIYGDLIPSLTGNLYDGEKLGASQDVVVVTLNYRLGALGWLAHPDLSRQSPTKVSGNYALLDLIAALQWVRSNIKSFGGDPDHVMIFGESAGAEATCLLLASPLAKGLFQAALMESGGCQAPPLATREADGQKLAVKVGCGDKPDVAACLRGAKPEDLVETPVSAMSFFNPGQNLLRTWDLPWGANVDGVVLTDVPIKTLREGRHHHVPLVVGSNAHEGELFVPPVINNCLEYTLDVTSRFGTLASQVLDLYPCTSYTLPRWAEVDVITDVVFTCPARRIARAVAASQQEPVFRYWYTHIYKTAPLLAMRAYHTAELAFVFRSFGTLLYTPTQGELGLSDAIQGYWARFAGTGSPAGAGAPTWAAYTGSTDNALVLDETLGTDSAIKSKQCDFWDSLSE